MGGSPAGPDHRVGFDLPAVGKAEAPRMHRCHARPKMQSHASRAQGRFSGATRAGIHASEDFAAFGDQPDARARGHFLQPESDGQRKFDPAGAGADKAEE